MQNPKPTPRPSPKMAEIKKVTPTHEAMMDWMLLNPGATLAQMGAYFGYSPAWLSQVINSDLFQALYREKRGEIDARVAMDIPAKMRGLVSVALDKLVTHVEKSEQPEFLLETADKVLHRLGYAPSKGPSVSASGPTTNIQQNVYIADSGALAAAREKMAQLGASVVPALPVDVTIPLPESVPHD